MRETIDKKNQELDELFERYRRAPDSYVFVLLADACRKINRIDEALEICEEGVRRHPRYASGYVVKGKCLYDKGRFDEARHTFEEVLILDENNLVALKFLGMLEAEAGRYDGARRYLERILRLDPENKEIQRTLVELGRQDWVNAGEGTPGALEDSEETSEEDDEAGEDSRFEVERELETSDELATITLAEIFAEQGYRQKALKIYEELLKKQPRSKLIRGKIAALSGEEPEDVALEHSVVELGYEDEVGDGDMVGFEEIVADSKEAEPKPAEPKKAAKKAPGKAPGGGPSNAPKKASEADPEPPQPPRREIDEKENLVYFKRWLNRVSD